jgi:hypothetical protein|tara:strand:+ start:548 stop:766 length:219 start_codon:yes stop_codon:yes gene_type:complete
MMITLLLILGGILVYLFFDKGFWLDTWARSGEESMKGVREEYKRRNNDKESWMTKHDREYEHQQEEKDKWQQ